MNKHEKESFIKRKVGFFYSNAFNTIEVEGTIKDVSSIGFIIEITKSKHNFYEVGKEYFIPLDKFIYKFL
jgi:ribosomal protein L31